MILGSARSAGVSSAAPYRHFRDREALIADVLCHYGEGRAARRIARAIVAARPLSTTGQLAEVVQSCLPRPKPGQSHPATRSFQAIRIAVNDEYGELVEGLEAAERALKPGGQLAVVTFHSIEDRIVKRFLQLKSDSGGGGSRHAPAEAEREPASEGDSAAQDGHRLAEERLEDLRRLQAEFQNFRNRSAKEKDGLREYVVGDDVRSIDWRSSARRGDSSTSCTPNGRIRSGSWACAPSASGTRPISPRPRRRSSAVPPGGRRARRRRRATGPVPRPPWTPSPGASRRRPCGRRRCWVAARPAPTPAGTRRGRAPEARTGSEGFRGRRRRHLARVGRQVLSWRASRTRGRPLPVPEVSEAAFEGVAMPLSEHEQRMLDQLEQQLRTEDPRLATQMADTGRHRLPVGRVVAGAVLAVVGLLVVVLGVANHAILLGVLGVVVIGAGIFLLTTRPRAVASGASGPEARRSGAPRRQGGGDFMGRLERRWDERRAGGD